MRLLNVDGNEIPLGSDRAQEDAVVGIRRTTLAARLKAIYGSPDRLDAFVDMLSERQVPGTEFGELQLAIWKRQFEALGDGDRFFYLNDPRRREIRRRYGLDYRRTLASIIRSDTGAAVPGNVFQAPAASAEAGTPAPVTAGRPPCPHGRAWDRSRSGPQAFAPELRAAPAHRPRGVARGGRAAGDGHPRRA